MPIVYDGSLTNPDTHVLGPGNPTLIHAFPDGSRVSLCGKTRAENPAAIPGRHCQACVAISGRRAMDRKMSRPDADVLWQKYLTTCRLGGTKDERRSSFDRWWRAERADAAAAWNSQKRKDRKRAAEAVR